MCRNIASQKQAALPCHAPQSAEGIRRHMGDFKPFQARANDGTKPSVVGARSGHPCKAGGKGQAVPRALNPVLSDSGQRADVLVPERGMVLDKCRHQLFALGEV